jgi:hypothetical protein
MDRWGRVAPKKLPLDSNAFRLERLHGHVALALPLLHHSQFAMTVATDDNQFVTKLASRDVMELQVARIILAADNASGFVSSEPFELSMLAKRFRGGFRVRLIRGR